MKHRALIAALALLIAAPAGATTVCPPPSTPVLPMPAAGATPDASPSSGANHRALKQSAAVLAVGALIYCVVSGKCWHSDAPTFSAAQPAPDMAGPQ